MVGGQKGRDASSSIGRMKWHTVVVPIDKAQHCNSSSNDQSSEITKPNLMECTCLVSMRTITMNDIYNNNEREMIMRE